MKLSYTLVLSSIIFAATFTACQKESSFELGSGNGNGNGNGGGTGSGSGSGGSGSDIIGNYTFIELEAKTKSTSVANQMGAVTKGVSFCEYTTFDNKGTVTITNDKFIIKGMEYSIETTQKADMYINDTYITSYTTDVSYTMPPTSSESSYKRINADSLYFSAGITTTSNGTTSLPSGPTGARVRLSNDTLYFTLYASTNQTLTIQGVATSIKGEVVGTIKLKKQ